MPNDTSELRAWLASQLKLQDVPQDIWETLLEDGDVKEAQDPYWPDGRQSLVSLARKYLKFKGPGSVAPKTSKRQPTGKRQRATAARRSEVVAEIAAKIDKARLARNLDVSPDSTDELPTPSPEESERRTASLPRGPDPEELKRKGIEPPKLSSADLPLVGEIKNSRITITADPSVSPDAVRREFESLRDVWFWTPTPSARRVELVHFVAGFCDGYCNEEQGIVGLASNESWPGWRELLDRWNERYPEGHDWHYTDVRNIRRDFVEAFETLTSYKDF